MGEFFDSLDGWFTELLRSTVQYGLDGMFYVINYSVDEASTQLRQDPETWNSGILSVIRSVSINAVVPIAIIILSLVICYDLIQTFLDKSIRDIEPEIVLKFGFKAFAGVYLLNHTFDLTIGVFKIGQFVVDKATGVFGETSEISFDLYETFHKEIENMNVAELAIAFLEIGFMNIVSLVVSIAVLVVTAARMIEIYIYCSAAPIPFATLTNKEWGSVGTNYIRNIFALAFQAFFMMICVGIYSGLVNNVAFSPTDSLMWGLGKCMALSIVLVMMLFKCSSISKSIFNAL